MNEKKWLTIPELAKKMGISRIAVYNRVRKGTIPAQKIAGRFVISKDDLPYIIGRKLTKEDKNRIASVVKKAVDEYGQVFKWLSME